MASKSNRKITQSIRFIITFLFLLSMFFAAAGSLKWPNAWVFLSLYFFYVAMIFIYLKKHNPDLLKERLNRKKTPKPWDRIVMFVYLIFLCSVIIISGLDFRFQWSKVPLWGIIAGFIGLIPAAAIISLAMRENTYLSDVVRIQQDRGHQVCSTGPYKLVRHPMYVGVINMVLMMPLVLGSLYAFIPAGLTATAFVVRTALEDKTLKAELSGYLEYAQKTRFRLLPGIW